ncbi:hypothetical protein GCM10009430_43990 [Aquimarina litoralis]|uniref:Tetratricopeptide repeat protein n=1 Tax=Aquimarina litoralis TaxID=584605 RepID=A0ABP3UI25_9FLAO
MNIKKKNKKLFIALEFLVFLIIPIIVFVVITSKNRKKIINNSAVVQIEKKLSPEELLKQNALIETGIKLINTKKYKESIEINLKALKIGNSKFAHNNLCFAYGKIGKFEKGIEHCENAILLDQNFQLAKNNLKLIKSWIPK